MHDQDRTEDKMTKWQEFKRDFEGLGWIAGAFAGAIILTLPLWLILLGWA